MPNPVEGIDQSNAPYVIVSSDTHAGLYVEDYRPYLEASVHAEFDEWLTTRHQHRAMVEELNGEYVEQWERLLDFADEIKAFAKANSGKLTRKNG